MLAKRSGKAVAGWVLALQLATGVAHGNEAFNVGVSHFKAGEYASAVDWFEQARQQGVDSAVLDYNLAVAHYKLEQYALARPYFASAAETPALAPLSFYNLGLVAVKVGDDDAALTWFRRTSQSTDDESLLRLSETMLEKLDDRPPAPQRPVKRWSGWFSAGLGYDDNVSRVNDDLTAVSNQDDLFLDAYGSIDYRLNGNRRRGNMIRFGAALTRYGDLEFYNQLLVNAGLYHYHPLGAWRTRVGGHYYHDWLNDEPYQQRINIQLRADRRYGEAQRLRLQYDYSRLDELDARYEFVTGDRQRFKIENSTRGEKSRFKLGYRLELNDREDLASGANFISHSPTRHTFFAGLRHNFTHRWLGRLDGEYRYSRYADNEVITGVDRGRREDDRFRGTVRAVYRFTPSFEWELMYRHTRNESNFVDEDYSVNQVVLSLNASF